MYCQINQQQVEQTEEQKLRCSLCLENHINPETGFCKWLVEDNTQNDENDKADS